MHLLRLSLDLLLNVTAVMCGDDNRIHELILIYCVDILLLTNLRLKVSLTVHIRICSSEIFVHSM